LTTDVRELVVGNAFFIAALLAFALNFVAYAVALKRLPLSVAYPIMVVASFVLVNGFSHYYFGEEIVGMQVIGYVFILIGIIAVVAFSRS
jgi:small multidrug resistance pump